MAPLLAAALLLAVPDAQQRAALRIVVIEGEGAVNIVQQKTAVAPIVEVRDRNDQPVAGAVVTFSTRGGRAASFAGGSQTLTVTTNAAGRAIASALTPLSNGSFQIQVQAAFQGQTAIATIAQTNVMTAAQAATAAGSTSGGAGGGSAGSAGAAGGGSAGGGISGATLGIIAGAVAGGAVAATSLGGEASGDASGPSSAAPGRTLSGPYDTRFAMTVTNPDGSGPCAFTTAYAGNLRMTVLDNGGGLTGTAEMIGTKAVVTPGCGLGANTFFDGTETFTVSGTAAALTFSRTDTFLGSNNVTVTETISFGGSLTQDSIAGTLSISRREVGSTPVPRIGTGGSSQQLTLR